MPKESAQNSHLCILQLNSYWITLSPFQAVVGVILLARFSYFITNYNDIVIFALLLQGAMDSIRGHCYWFVCGTGW